MDQKPFICTCGWQYDYMPPGGCKNPHCQYPNSVKINVRYPSSTKKPDPPPPNNDPPVVPPNSSNAGWWVAAALVAIACLIGSSAEKPASNTTSYSTPTPHYSPPLNQQLQRPPVQPPPSMVVRQPQFSAKTETAERIDTQPQPELQRVPPGRIHNDTPEFVSKDDDPFGDYEPFTDRSPEEERELQELRRKYSESLGVEQKAQEEAETADERATGEYRVWTYDFGVTLSGQARVESIANGVVTLRTLTGDTVKVNIASLTHSDQEVIEKWRKEQHSRKRY